MNQKLADKVEKKIKCKSCDGYGGFGNGICSKCDGRGHQVKELMNINLVDILKVIEK